MPGREVPLYPWSYPNDVIKAGIPPFRTVKLTRIHLEEDAAKITHHANYSLIDYNRAGSALMEIVSEPDIDTPEEAYAYLKSLQQILNYGDISDADMEKGQMRCDVNISLRPHGQKELGAKVEMKNINSMSAVRRALHYEIQRQAEELDMGIPQIQSTRRWDDERGESVVMRTKEDAHDYRYFPCPDLVPVRTAPLVEKVRGQIPELPQERQKRFMEEYGLSEYDANVLVGDLELARFFEEAARGTASGKKIANWVINNISAVLNEKGMRPSECPVKPGAIRELIAIIDDGTVSNNQAKDVFAKMWDEPALAAAQAAKLLGFEKADSSFLDGIVREVISANPDKVAEIQGGNEKAPELAYRPGHEGRQRQSQPENRDGSAEKKPFPWSDHKQRAASLADAGSLPAGHHGLNSFLFPARVFHTCFTSPASVCFIMAREKSAAWPILM